MARRIGDDITGIRSNIEAGADLADANLEIAYFERAILEHFPERVTIRTMGEGFTWDTQDRQRDIAAAKAAWQAAQEMMADESYDLIVLDELNIVLRYDYLPLSEIIAALQARREGLHIMVTGRNAKEALIEAADMVTEMSEIKHHFKAGVKAQTGIEF